MEGSAQLRLPDGSHVQGRLCRPNNGRNYTSVGLALVEAGLLPKEQLTLSNLIKFFQQNPEKMDEYPPAQRAIRLLPEDRHRADGLPGRAGDRALHHRDGQEPFPARLPGFRGYAGAGRGGSGEPVKARWQHFALDQDSGGAIRAAGRADIYVGIGDQAGRIAGWMLDEGRLYYLFLK